MIIFAVSLFPSPAAECAEPDTITKTPIFCPQACVLTGKTSLDMGDFDKALLYLTAAYNEMPFLGDYILLWRAEAFAGKSDKEKALEDLARIKKDFPESPLIKRARMKEIEILRKDSSDNVEDLLRKFISDYPKDYNAKFAYSVYLKNNNKKEKAKTLFREIFASVSPFSKRAAEELSESDIRTVDLLKRGQNLNKAWHFRESEKLFKKALSKKDSGPVKKEINEGLALSLFRQKRYRESAALYAEGGDQRGRARSLYRAGDWAGFNRSLAVMIRQKDPQAAPLMIAYGSKKRRNGNAADAISIFEDVISRFPDAREEALWQKGWTLYRTGDYQTALGILETLHRTYGGARYLYWKNRCLEMSGAGKPEQQLEHNPNDRNNNFYFLMVALRGKGGIPAFENNGADRCSGYRMPRRIETLDALGFGKEAIYEIMKAADKGPDAQDIACLSSYLKSRNDFKRSITMAARLPFREELHDLYYPLAYSELVDEAAAANGLDPLLVLSIMREESRFASDARSPAGALGLMQLMPQTAAKISRRAKVSIGGPDELYDARTNVMIGSYYLAALVRHFGSIPPAIASYNAGEDAVKEWLSSGGYKTMDEFVEDIPYDETRNYVKKVMTSYLEYMRRQGKKEMPALLIKSWNL